MLYVYFCEKGVLCLENQNTVKSVEKALKILLLFSEQEPQLSNSEIASRMEIPTPTASRLIKTLTDMGYLTKNTVNGKYMLGGVLFYLGNLASGSRDLLEASKPVLDQIVGITNETAHVFVRDGIHRVCLVQSECKQTIRQVSVIGERAPIWEGSTGRVLLGFQKPEILTALLTEIKERYPEVDLDTVFTQAMQTKEQGYASKTRRGENHVGCIAAPIFDEHGVVNACLGVSMPEFRYPANDNAFIRVVCDGAQEISRRLK